MSEDAVEVVRGEALWFEPTADGMAPLVDANGPDLYTPRTSIEAVLTYLQKVDRPGAERARYRYGCLEPLERWAHDETDVPETYPTGM